MKLMTVSILFCHAADLAPLGQVHRVLRQTVVGTRAQLDLNENQDAFLPADQVDFAIILPIIPGNDPVAVFSQATIGQLLARLPPSQMKRHLGVWIGSVSCSSQFRGQPLDVVREKRTNSHGNQASYRYYRPNPPSKEKTGGCLNRVPGILSLAVEGASLPGGFRSG